MLKFSFKIFNPHIRELGVVVAAFAMFSMDSPLLAAILVATVSPSQWTPPSKPGPLPSPFNKFPCHLYSISIVSIIWHGNLMV